MATSKDDIQTAQTKAQTEAQEARKKEPRKTYRLIRGSHSMPAPEEMTRTESMSEGVQTEVTYAEGSMVRYVADDPTRNVIELTEAEARRFLFNPAGAKLAEPRIEEYKEAKKEESREGKEKK